jgi:AhpD family alkylhydroperoxidase
LPAKQPITEEMSNMNCCEHGEKGDSPHLPERPEGCCAQMGTVPFFPASGAAGVAVTEQKFREFLQAAAAPGALDGKTKRAIAIALSVMARCEPCIKSHAKKAREMGFTQEEIDEAAWLGISFGGSPTMAFYNSVRKALFS